MDLCKALCSGILTKTNKKTHTKTHLPDVDYLLGLHLKETRRNLVVPGHRSGPKTRLLTRSWQDLRFWHSSSTF